MSSSPSQRSGAALLWDESFLWGVMAYRALESAGLPFDLITAEEVRNGSLSGYAMLFAPGGWSSNKLKALGDTGAEAIRTFVKMGGNYLGFCGGAGLATLDGIGLLPIKRTPTKARVPSFSGPIRLNISKHAVWHGITDPVFYAWWPPQLQVMDDSISILATYQEALPEAFSSDLNVGDMIMAGRSWEEFENLYRIYLDPRRISGEPAVIEGRFGKGMVVLSLVHFDTPDDINGSTALKNIWGYLAGNALYSASECRKRGKRRPPASSAAFSISAELKERTSDLIALGIRNFLWYRRNSLLTQWRRGVRGLEYCTLEVMISEMASLISDGTSLDLVDKLKELKNELLPFIEKAGRLLVMERLAMQRGHITYEHCDDLEIQGLREELFSKSKSYGGRFKELLDMIDSIVFSLLRERETDSLFG